MSEFVSRKFVATVDDILITKGKVYETYMQGDLESFNDDNDSLRHLFWHLKGGAFLKEITEPETQAIQIEEGKFYIARNGRKVGPMIKPNPGDFDPAWTFTVEKEIHSEFGKAWRENGSFNPCKTEIHDLDLISEYKEPEIKVGDLYTFVGSHLANGAFVKGSAYTVKEISKTVGYTQIVTSNNIPSSNTYWREEEFRIHFVRCEDRFVVHANEFSDGRPIEWSPWVVPIQVGDKVQYEGKTLTVKEVISGDYDQYEGLYEPKSPIQTTTVKKIISGDYGRLHVDSDGYRSLNLSIIDGKSRCVSVDEMREMIRVLEEIILAKEEK